MRTALKGPNGRLPRRRAFEPTIAGLTVRNRTNCEDPRGEHADGTQPTPYRGTETDTARRQHDDGG